MTYTVVWIPTAREELATIWMNTRERASVSRAANTMIDVLRKVPLDVGESRNH